MILLGLAAYQAPAAISWESTARSLHAARFVVTNTWLRAVAFMQPFTTLLTTKRNILACVQAVGGVSLCCCNASGNVLSDTSSLFID
jgi:hypothetical protein